MISIIIPVYNAEKYIGQCIESILNQTYSDWELVLVDDGSTDSSTNICDYYSKIDKRIRVFHQKNSGCSSARNAGLVAIRGEWVTFVDADDFVSETYLLHMYVSAANDLVISGYKGYPSMEESVSVGCDSKKSIMNNFDLSEKTSLFVYYFPWAKLYKTNVIKKNNLKFCEDMRLSEDSCFIIKYLAHCSTISLVPSADYYYRSETNMSKYRLTYKEFLTHITELTNSLNYYEKHKGKKLQYVFNHFASILFYYYKDFLFSANYLDYRLNTELWTRTDWKNFSLLLNESFLKKILYKTLILHPNIGYYLSRFLRFIKIEND